MAMYKGDELKRLRGSERLGQNRESEYLGAEDIDPGTEPILTILYISNGTVTLQRGRENKDVLFFAEKSVPGINNVRPLIVNATNRKNLKKAFGTVTADALEGQKIQLYIDHKVRNPEDGTMTDGIRIRPNKPKIAAIKCEGCGKNITAAYGMTPEQLAAYTYSQYGKKLCAECATKAKQQSKQQAQPVEPKEGADDETHG